MLPVASGARLVSTEVRPTMNFRLAESDKTRGFAGRIEMTVEEMLSRQYIRFCSTDPWKPNINVYETEEAIVVCADLAGMKPHAIRVEVEGNSLVLRGERPRPIPAYRGSAIGVHLMEIDTGAFCRELELPETVNRSRITAKYTDGLLWITMPKEA
jgi:HSP20 family molecular chaperone IbpA